jgi:hypothetical protein
MYTDEQLKELIDCHKKIVDPPKYVKLERATFTKKVFGLSSFDDVHDFSGFITQSTKFQENFSIGLIYKPKLERNSIVLLRCNGIHGGVNNFVPHHSYCHIHYVQQNELMKGLSQKEKL